MSFKARCSFCQHEIRVPDHAMGKSVRCPNCRDQFTIAPIAMEGPLTAHWQSKISPETNDPIISPKKDSEVSNPDHAISKPVHSPEEPKDKPEGVPPWRKHLNPGGVLAGLLGGLGLMVASFQDLGWLTIPLSVLGLCIGFLSVVWIQINETKGKGVAVAGTLVSALVCGIAIFSPKTLGPVYESRSWRKTAETTVSIVPLQLNEETPKLDEAGYVDASQAGLEQSGLRMSVVSVSVGNPKKSSKKKASQKQLLMIRLRVQKVQDGKEFNKGLTVFSNSQELPKLTVTDSTEKKYHQRSFDSFVSMEKDPRPPPFPVTVIDEEFAFEPAPDRGRSLRLEVPTKPWGGNAIFRFRIPESMINHDAPPTTSQTGKSGGG